MPTSILKNIQGIVLFLICCSGMGAQTFAQAIPDQKVLDIQELPNYLKADKRKALEVHGEISPERLAAYFRAEFSERFFYDHKDFYTRLENYHKIYGNQSFHKNRALDHYHKYAATTPWVLPFDYQNGGAVNAYALRHLARQHKMVDIALHYFEDSKNPIYIKYFEEQMQSLNSALASGAYEKIKDGNGVYEVFRSGYRIFNWLWIHNMFLNETEYSGTDQLRTIATLLQHGQHLYERNDSFRAGNHQTKGMSSLAVLAILLRDFKGTEQWYDRAMLRLSEHLDKEINPDGFQFERSVHYHMSDINNYFYVYQLAKINQLAVDKSWEQKLRSLFTTLTKIAYPDKSAPVLQDDTEIPWAEKNDISGVMTLGYLLFEEPEFGYFATDQVDDRMYWYLSKAQVEQLTNIQQKQPSYGSLALEDTHYYIMREGWDPDDKMMIISAGLDPDKPDHQHGDMLGVQAIANGQIVLPNYQVRYSLKDFELFKNSMVKNVALVDDQLQGKRWTSNKGGSGFGKFKKLPQPTVIAWKTHPAFDHFVGSHDGFEDSGVHYSRQVIYVKDAFWIVKDNFQSDVEHDYKQVWQGHYTTENGPDLLRSSFVDAVGCDILQLKAVDTATSSGARGKNWTVIAKNDQKEFDFLTLIFPYKGYNKRIDETKDRIRMSDWEVNASSWEIRGKAPVVLTKGDQHFFFGVQEIKQDELSLQFSVPTDVYLSLEGKRLELQLLGDQPVTVQLGQGETDKNKGVTKLLQPGAHVLFDLD